MLLQRTKLKLSPPETSPRIRSGWPELGAAVLIGIVLGLALGHWPRRNASLRPQEPIESDFAHVARLVSPAVVSIEVVAPFVHEGAAHETAASASDAAASAAGGHEHNLGSGVIVDPQGYIITNQHVVDRAEHIQVALASDEARFYDASLVGEDRDTDLAVLRIDAGAPLPFVRWGDARRVRVGERVLAIGSPYGLNTSVTGGIISALDRRIDDAYPFQRFIQTDAAINPGNSGGPLLDRAGNLIGINTAIYSDADGNRGVGFALPATTVREVYRTLRQTGRVVRGSLGIYYQGKLDSAVRRMYRLERGVMVSQVVAGGPAALSGLQAGDVILSINDQAVNDGDALTRQTVGVPIHQRVRVNYRRGDRIVSIMVPVADRARIFPDVAATPPVPAARPGREEQLGLRVTGVSNAVTIGRVSSGRTGGVVVRRVQEGSWGDDVGLMRGDVVVSMNRQPITGVEQYHRVMQSLHPGEALAIEVRRPAPRGQWDVWYAGGTLPR